MLIDDVNVFDTELDIEYSLKLWSYYVHCHSWLVFIWK